MVRFAKIQTSKFRLRSRIRDPIYTGRNTRNSVFDIDNSGKIFCNFYVEKEGNKSNPEELGKLAGEESLFKSKNFYLKKK